MSATSNMLRWRPRSNNHAHCDACIMRGPWANSCILLWNSTRWSSISSSQNLSQGECFRSNKPGYNHDIRLHESVAIYEVNASTVFEHTPHAVYTSQSFSRIVFGPSELILNSLMMIPLHIHEATWLILLLFVRVLLVAPYTGPITAPSGSGTLNSTPVYISYDLAWFNELHVLSMW